MVSLFNFSSADQKNEKDFSNINESNFNEKNNPKASLLINAWEVLRNNQKSNEANFKLTNYSNNVSNNIGK
jgi:hypothetical protein